jgi:hypothetical protein
MIALTVAADPCPTDAEHARAMERDARVRERIALGEAKLIRAVAAIGERKPGPRRPVVLP